MRDLLSLVDQGIDGILLRETQAELARVSRAIHILRRRLTHLGICLLAIIRSDPLFVPELIGPALRQTLSIMDDLKGKGKGKLAMDFAKGKGKSEEDLLRAQAFHT